MTSVSVPSMVCMAGHPWLEPTAFVNQVADGELVTEGGGFPLLEETHGLDHFGDFRAWCRRRGGDEPGDGFAVSSDGDALAALDPLQQSREVRLGFIRTDGCH